MSTRSTNERSFDFSDFFSLHDPLASRPLRFAPLDPTLGGLAVPLSRGELTFATPIVVQATMGVQASPFLWSTMPPLLLVNDLVITILKEAQFTGWTTYPVRLLGRKAEEIYGYHGFAVTGRCGELDLKDSRLITIPAPSPKGKSYQVRVGVYFKPEAWDGSDIFMFSEWGYRIFKRQVVEAFKRAKLKNISFVPLQDERT